MQLCHAGDVVIAFAHLRPRCIRSSGVLSYHARSNIAAKAYQVVKTVQTLAVSMDPTQACGLSQRRMISHIRLQMVGIQVICTIVQLRSPDEIDLSMMLLRTA
jgi:hypothetical protein